MTKLGDDPFGDYIVEVLDEAGIDTSHIKRDKEAETALAFVSLASDGNRDFKFYRKNSADLRYSVYDIEPDVLDDCGMIHFCSVDLVNSPMKDAHKKLIDMANGKDVLVSFDPNLRFSLWDDLQELKETVNEFLPFADIIKISDEELEFITGHTDIREAVPDLLNGRTKYVIYTCLLYTSHHMGLQYTWRCGRRTLWFCIRTNHDDRTSPQLYCHRNSASGRKGSDRRKLHLYDSKYEQCCTCLSLIHI